MKDKNSLLSIVKVCSKIREVQLSDLALLWKKQAVRKAKSIIGHPDLRAAVLCPPEEN